MPDMKYYLTETEYKLFIQLPEEVRAGIRTQIKNLIKTEAADLGITATITPDQEVKDIIAQE